MQLSAAEKLENEERMIVSERASIFDNVEPALEAHEALLSTE
ncbi:MAG: hypothetical protein AAF699_01975 [Pseudomonadota bacterium]